MLLLVFLHIIKFSITMQPTVGLLQEFDIAVLRILQTEEKHALNFHNTDKLYSKKQLEIPLPKVPSLNTFPRRRRAMVVWMTTSTHTSSPQSTRGLGVLLFSQKEGGNIPTCTVLTTMKKNKVLILSSWQNQELSASRITFSSARLIQETDVNSPKWMRTGAPEVVPWLLRHERTMVSFFIAEGRGRACNCLTRPISLQLDWFAATYFYSHFHPHTSYNSTGCATVDSGE